MIQTLTHNEPEDLRSLKHASNPHTQRARRSKKSHACINWFKQQPNQKLQSPLPDGRWTVLGPALFMNLLTSLMLANVPRDMTASLPRREPYELNSLGVNLGIRRVKAEYSTCTCTRMHYRTCPNHTLVPRPRLAFRCLQYEKVGRGSGIFSHMSMTYSENGENL